jgi:hypothetical protein
MTPMDHRSTASPYPHASRLSRIISGAMYLQQGTAIQRLKILYFASKNWQQEVALPE